MIVTDLSLAGVDELILPNELFNVRPMVLSMKPSLNGTTTAGTS